MKDNPLLQALTAAVFLLGGYFFLDDLHASKTAVLESYVELRGEILDTDIKKDAEARVYYRDLAEERPLTPAEQRRLDYLEEQLDRKQGQQLTIQAKQLELKQ